MIGINSVDLVFFILFLGGFVAVELCVCCSVFVLFVWFWALCVVFCLVGSVVV